MSRLRVYTKWLTPGIGVKRWLVLLLIGITVSAVSILLGILKYVNLRAEDMTLPILRWREIALVAFVGLVFVSVSVFRIAHNILEPYRKHQRGAVVDVVYAHSKRQRGMKLVAIGGGTGLPAVLRGLKALTS